MSLLIKGLEMPMRGERQRLTIQICSDGSVYVIKSCAIYAEEYLPKCTAKELPPHGRLIDENDVMKSAEELRKSPWYNDEPYHAMRKDGFEMAIDMAVKDAPTIIEAEE